MSVNHYQTLGVAERATTAEIKKAYYALCKKYHPDVNGDQQKMVAVNQAYEVLASDWQRSAHDRALAEARRAIAQKAQAQARQQQAYQAPLRPQPAPQAYRRPVAVRKKSRLNIRMRPWVIAGGIAVAITYAILYLLPLPSLPVSAAPVAPDTSSQTATTTPAVTTPAPTVSDAPTTDQITDTATPDTTNQQSTPTDMPAQTPPPTTNQATQPPTRHRGFTLHWPIKQ